MIIGAAITNNATTGYQYGVSGAIIMDNEIFNQDIYVTHNDNHASQNCNYYIELEQIKLSDVQSTSITLQSLRGSSEPGVAP